MYNTGIPLGTPQIMANNSLGAQSPFTVPVMSNAMPGNPFVGGQNPFAVQTAAAPPAAMPAAPMAAGPAKRPFQRPMSPATGWSAQPHGMSALLSMLAAGIPGAPATGWSAQPPRVDPAAFMPPAAPQPTPAGFPAELLAGIMSGQPKGQTMPPVHIDPMPTDVGVPLALSQPVNPQPSADALFQRYGMLPRQLQPAGNQGLAQLLQSLLGGQPT